jgi:hypothetical protein
MALSDKLRRLGSYVRERRRSLGPEGYSQYKRGRDSDRKRAVRERERAMKSAEREREVAERGREYDERYTRQRERDIARERTERAEETEPDR